MELWRTKNDGERSIVERDEMGAGSHGERSRRAMAEDISVSYAESGLTPQVRVGYFEFGMFKNLLKELKKIELTSRIDIPIEADSEGYYDKECPAENCLFGFKVQGEDLQKLVSEEEMFCPACRHAAPFTSWYTRDQIERSKEYALKTLRGSIDEAMRRDARDWNHRQPRNSLLRMTLEVRGGSQAVLVPLAAAEPMRLRTACGCRYSYVGAAFFCPACGANSAEHTFRQTLGTVRAAAASGDALRKLLDADQAEVVARSLLEKGVQDTVMCFQRLAEQLYARFPGAATPRRNAFQNLIEASNLWASAAGQAFDQMLAPDEMRKLRVYFQQRHLLAHCQGIVDADYVARSGDTVYAAGQRITIQPAAVLEFADLVERLGSAVIVSAQQP